MTQPRPDLDSALDQLQVQALNFGSRFINDAAVRQEYIKKTQTLSRELRAACDSGRLTAQEATASANQLRNEIMDAARTRLSDRGRAKSAEIKARGLDLDQLTRRYAERMFQRDFDALTRIEKDRVLLEIIDASGRANPKVSVQEGRLGALGRGLWVFTAVVAVYNIGTADDKVHAAGREATTLGGGFGGSAVTGALAGIWFGPLGVAVGVVIGGVLGAIVSDTIYVELTGPRVASVRRFLPRFTSVTGTDEAGIAAALVEEYGIDLDSVVVVFRELSHRYRTDVDDVARQYLDKVRAKGGAVEHALRVHGTARNLLISILNGGWTSGPEYAQLKYIRGL